MKKLRISAFMTLVVAMFFILTGNTEVKADNSKKTSKMTIVEIASSDDRFSILVDAVVKAGLVDALSSDGPFTVFAPTNDAFISLFKKLGVNGIEDLSKEDLTPILLYHVVSAQVMAKDVSTGKVKTLNDKSDLNIRVKDGGVMIDNSANVIITDINANNGVIHVIDAVLVPQQESTAKSSSGCGS